MGGLDSWGSGRRGRTLCGPRSLVIMWPAMTRGIVTAGDDPAQETPRPEGPRMALEFAPGKTRIGWIGTGVMGSSMCGHLIAAGYAATIFNRTPDKSKALV